MLAHEALDNNFSWRPRLDTFWLKDESLEASDNLPDPDVIAHEIVDDIESALEQFKLIANDLGREAERVRYGMR
jgi:hypothetical protein